MREQKALITFFKSRQAVDAGIIIVTVFETAGSTYQKPGTRLLVTPDGEHCGLISGGCLEPEIIRQAQSAWRQQKVTAWQIDTRDETEKWLGYGLGCKGMFWLVFEPLNFEHAKHKDLTVSILTGDQALQQVTHVYWPKSQVLARAVQTQEALSVDAQFPEAILDAPSAQLNDALILRESFKPALELFIFAGGIDAVPLAELCGTLGWQYHAICRDELLCQENWPNAESVTTLNREHPTHGVGNNESHYAVVMTHNFELDLKILSELTLKTKIPYIGLLGPRHRRASLLDALSQNNLPSANLTDHQAEQARLYAPVGLPLGGRQPSEIALSIAAQIQAVKHESEFRCDTKAYNRPVKKLHENISVVILAAGASKRLGFPKQLIEFRGKSLLRSAIDKARTVANHGIYVVLGAHFEKITESLNKSGLRNPSETQAPILPAEHIIYNPQWQSGLASSIQAGFNAAIANPERSPEHSVLFILVDQPLVTPQHLARLIKAGQEKQTNIVASQYVTTAADSEVPQPHLLGVPALMAADQAPAINHLRGNAGCKQIIKQSKHYSFVSCANLNFDIDYPADLINLTRLKGATCSD